MKKYHLVIGGNDFSTAEIANKMFTDSKLATNHNVDQLMEKVKCIYTSLADVDQETLLKLCKSAISIIYWPPLHWSEESLRIHTEATLIELVLRHKFVIKNFNIVDDQFKCLELADSRKTKSPQLWVAGCSYAYGFGLPHPSQRYIERISTATKMKFSDLTVPGSSIDWAADQIIRSDIKKGDVIVWGITGINRVSYYIDNCYLPIPALRPDMLTKNQQKFFDKLVTDDNRVIQAIKLISQVDNFTKKLGAKLFLVFHKELSLYAHSQLLELYISDFSGYVRISDPYDQTDDGHPGPETNNTWANEILQAMRSSGIYTE